MKLLWPAKQSIAVVYQSLYKAGLHSFADRYGNDSRFPPYQIPILIDDSGVIIREMHQFLHEKMFYSDAYKTEKTVKTYAECLVSWLIYTSQHGITWQCATNREILRYRNAMKNSKGNITKRPLSTQTINLRMVVIVDFYKFYWAKFIGATGVEAEISLKKLEQLSRGKFKLRKSFKRARALPLKTCVSLVKKLQGVHSLILSWGLITGLRISSLLNIRLEQFNELEKIDSDSFINTLSKGGRYAQAYIPASLREETRRYIDLDRNLNLARRNSRDQLENNLFLNTEGFPVTYSCYYSAFKRACDSLSIKSHPHQARTTFATVIERKIATSDKTSKLDSVKIVQGFLGHASSKTTEQYLENISGNNISISSLLDDMYSQLEAGK